LKKTILITTIVAFLLVALALLSTNHFANADSTRVYLSPSAYTFGGNTNVGTFFNVTAWVDNAPDIGGVQVYMEFNDSQINVTRWIEPTFNSSYIFNGTTTSALPTPPDPGYVHLAAGKARVQVAVSRFPTQAPWGHSGLICIFEFNITAVPPPGGQLTSTLHINNSAKTYILDPTGATVPGVELDDGSYTIVPEFPIALVLPIFLGLTLIAVAIRKKVLLKPKVKGF